LRLLLLYFLPPHGYLLPHGYAGPGLPAVGATFFHQQGELEIFMPQVHAIVARAREPAWLRPGADIDPLLRDRRPVGP